VVTWAGVIVGMRAPFSHMMFAAGLGLCGGAGRGHAFLEVLLVGLDFGVACEERLGRSH